MGMWKDRKVIPSPKPTTWEDFFEKTPLPSEDFMEQRIDLPLQTREDLF
ncbi:Prevent host death protein, Phd antitoxin [Crocosphaera watsonii WH 8502]|uniref:Prevent host death protein, Phd antitoxin n=1 Tax=Crocosphaera watsonii WH 8502 TaxID=423474 RepID=T2IHU2_CROWT|nr:Prevent host death protein, Phd antitoxin [Crocosphaera watsonii WH 8502]